MNDTLLQLLPLITILIIQIIIIAAIKIKVSNNKNGNSSQSNQEYRRLCKSKSNRAIAGVCGGIAEYFGWNATFVRLFFIFSGVGVFAYIILSIVLPDANSPLL
ncbi:MAG TPA: PspC domain-containing protein [Clostridia bacterium]|nr:PspC domain-containing protein [Clostridia bacterium]